MNDVTRLFYRLLQSYQYAHETCKLANRLAGKWRTVPKKGRTKLTFLLPVQVQRPACSFAFRNWLELNFVAIWAENIATKWHLVEWYSSNICCSSSTLFFGWVEFTLPVSWPCSWMTKLHFTLVYITHKFYLRFSYLWFVRGFISRQAVCTPSFRLLNTMYFICVIDKS